MARKDFLPQCHVWYLDERCKNTAEVMLQCEGKDVPGEWYCREHAESILAEYAPYQEDPDIGHWTARELNEYGR